MSFGGSERMNRHETKNVSKQLIKPDAPGKWLLDKSMYASLYKIFIINGNLIMPEK